MAFSSIILAVLATALIGSSLVSSLPTPAERTGVILPGNDFEEKDYAKAMLSTGFAYAMGAELTWRNLPEKIRCLVKQKYVNNQEPSIYVVKGDFDNAEEVLNSLRIRFTTLSVSELGTNDFSTRPKGKTLILNSGVNITDHLALKAIKVFVNKGGVLVTSNFAGENLMRIFPKKKLTHRSLTTLGASNNIAELNVDLPPTIRYQTHGLKTRDSQDCQRSVSFLQKPASDAQTYDLRPLWSLEETPLSISTGPHSRNSNKVISIVDSHDLRAPFDSVLSCLNRKKGSVYHFMGRLFQLLQTPTTELRANNMRIPIMTAMDLLRSTFDDLPSNMREANEEMLREHVPTLQEVTSASLSTGMVMRLLAREWKESDLTATMDPSDAQRCL